MLPRVVTFYDVCVWIYWIFTINQFSKSGARTGVLTFFRRDIAMAIGMHYGGGKHYTEMDRPPEGFMDLPMPPKAQGIFTELVSEVVSWKGTRLL